MGNLQSVNELSVSSVVEELHALAPEARSKGLDDLCEKHPQITEFLKTKYLKDPLLPPSKEPNRPPQVLSIKGPVPKEEKLEKLLETLEPWRKDVRSFWITKSSTFIPDETCRHPLRFIYAATVEELSQKESCLRRRYLALFWFDCFVKRYPGRGYDNEYSELSREIAGAVVDAETSIISRLRCQVSAGRRYNKLTEKFGDGILLILPSSIGKSTLECKLPLDDEAFEKFVSPLLGGWEECAMMEPIVSLGARIRRSLLEKCPEQGSPQEGSISSHESEKRKAQPSPQSPSQKSKQRRKHPPNAMVWSIPTPISTAPPTTPHISEQVYHSEGSNKHLDSPETAQVAQVNGVAVAPQDISTTLLSDERILHVCGGRNLPLAAVTGADDLGAVEHAIIGPERHHQDIEGVPRSAQYATNQRATEESGEMALPDRTEKTPKTRNNNEVQYDEDPMLSNLTAEDWERDVHLFRPIPFDPGVFAPVSMDSHPFLGTLSSPI